MATLTKNISYTDYNAFNPQGYSIGNASWYGWGNKYASKYGYAGVRAQQNIRYAFVYEFRTPSWGGSVTSLSLTFKLQEELGTSSRTVRWSVTTTDPTQGTGYTAQDLPSDSGRIDDGVITVSPGTEQSYSVSVSSSSIPKSTVMYLVLSPNTSSGSNYCTINDDSLSGYITYEADASDINAEDGYFGQSINIYMSDDGLVKTLSYTFGSVSDTIGNINTGHTIWTIPASLMSEIPTATSGQLTITCTSAGGTSSTTITAYVPDSIKPVFNVKNLRTINQNQTVYGWGITLQGYSKVQASIGAYALYSTIVSWRIDMGFANYSGTNSSQTLSINQNSDIITQAGTFTVTATVTDARGRAVTETVGTVTVQPYSTPSVTNVSIYRCRQDGTRDDREGTYLYAIATRVYSQVGSNSCSMQFQYKETSASQYTSVALTDGVGVIVGGGNIEVLKSYNARIDIVDSLSEGFYSVIISTQTVAFNLKPSADSGAAFGGYAQEDKILELFNGWKLRVGSSQHILIYDNGQAITLQQLIENIVNAAIQNM